MHELQKIKYKNTGSVSVFKAMGILNLLLIVTLHY
jgi:hypothetical protein